MEVEKFNDILTTRLQKIEATLGTKAREYAHDGDRLYNFKVAGRMTGVSPAEALWGMAAKHLVSVQDLVIGKLENKKEMVDEKCTDMINYLILLIAVLEEERCEQKIRRKK